jgi:hypothetical protein
MRVFTCLTAALLGTAVMLAQPPAASAQGLVEGSVEADQNWQNCISVTTPPDVKVAGCSAVIDAKRETGSKLAAAYCFRGHGLTESGSTMRRLPNSQGIPTARGCAWFAVQVRNVLKRA